MTMLTSLFYTYVCIYNGRIDERRMNIHVLIPSAWGSVVMLPYELPACMLLSMYAIIIMYTELFYTIIIYTSLPI
jgi:hypothetical protein